MARKTAVARKTRTLAERMKELDDKKEKLQIRQQISDLKKKLKTGK
jgi:hypothetical protein